MGGAGGEPQQRNGNESAGEEALKKWRISIALHHGGAAYSSSVLHAAAVSSEAERPMSNVDQPPEGRGGMREVGVEGRWRPLGRGRVGDAVSGGRRRHEGAPEGWSAGGPSPPETGAAPLRKTGFGGK